MSVRELPRLALRHWLFWAVDMATAIVGWVYGFGLEVKNWWALIGMMLGARWVCYVMFQSHNCGVVRRQVLDEIAAEKEGGAA